MNRTITIGNRPIGPGYPCYIIAELSANHGHDLNRAFELIDAAHAAGADAVKLQTYTADTLTLDCDRPEFQVAKGTLWAGRRMHELYQEAFTPWDWQPRLKQRAESLGMQCFSTPFDATAVEFLEAMGVPAHKIASFELVDHPLIARVARTGKPVIMSTGMATLIEIAEAVECFHAAGGTQLALLKCNSAYPAPASAMNLRTIPHLSDLFGLPVGLSDHTLGIAAAVTSVALGGAIIEKHLTIRRADGGPDSAFSLEPAEFRAMVSAVREGEASLGMVKYGPTPEELPSRRFRRSLFATREIKAGEPFSEANVRSIRPSDGLPPKYLDRLLGKPSPRNIPFGAPITSGDMGC